MFEIKYTIEKQVAVLGKCPEHDRQVEVNLIKYGNKCRRLDIRKWKLDGHTMSKGISLTYEQANALRLSLDKLGDLKEWQRLIKYVEKNDARI